MGPDRRPALSNKVYTKVYTNGRVDVMGDQTPQPVMTTRDARAGLSQIIAGFRASGASAQPVVLGAHRKPEAVLVPVELFERLAPLLEDLQIAAKAQERYSRDDGTRLTFAEIAEAAGFDPASFD